MDCFVVTLLAMTIGGVIASVAKQSIYINKKGWILIHPFLSDDLRFTP